jgi:hypothetical protein
VIGQGLKGVKERDRNIKIGRAQLEYIRTVGEHEYEK